MERISEFRTGMNTHTRSASAVATLDAPAALPELAGHRLALRELRASDAPALFSLLTAHEVARFISEPPSSVAGFERFIANTSTRDRGPSRQICFAIVLPGEESPVGIIQIRELEANFRTAEWGFALGSAYWGTGIFSEAASLALEFIFGRLGVHRLEARAALRNGRGGRALQKLGAVPEGVLRKAFLKDGEYLDQVLYAIVDEDWRASREVHQVAPSASSMRVH